MVRKVASANDNTAMPVGNRMTMTANVVLSAKAKRINKKTKKNQKKKMARKK